MIDETNNLSETDYLQETPFPYEELLSYYRGELREPDRCAEILVLVENNSQWKAHYNSIQFLDMERAAAIQDGKDLQELLDTWNSGEQEPSCFCLEVARTEGNVYEPLIQGEDRDHEILETVDRWDEHIDQCVYCRRMRRLAHAKFEREECDPPIEEPLLRDWLLEDHYRSALEEATECVSSVRVTEGNVNPVITTPDVPWWKKVVPHRFAVAASLLIVFTGAGYVKSLADLRNMHGYFGLDSFWQVVGEDEDHPSTDPQWARPVVIVGQDAWVKGKVKVDLIQELHVTVVPGLKEGEAKWQTQVNIDPADAHAGIVPFDIRFTVPNDRVTRKVITKLIPYPEALAAAPESLREDRLTFQVNIACLAAGPIAYVPDQPKTPVLRGPIQVDKDSAMYEVEVEERLWGTKDVWVAVIPDDDPSRIYLQGTKINSVESNRLVYLELGDGKTEGEFQVVVLSCPKGKFPTEGLVHVREIEESGKIHTSIDVRRIK